jgi:hypothetical protein
MTPTQQVIIFKAISVTKAILVALYVKLVPLIKVIVNALDLA